MEMKIDIPFRQLLTAIKTLAPSQKAKLKQELSDTRLGKDDKASFIEMLLNGPVITKDQIEIIEENRKSIAKWRTKN